LFGEKYEEDVSVVSMGEFPWNCRRETHVAAKYRDIGLLKYFRSEAQGRKAD